MAEAKKMSKGSKAYTPGKAQWGASAPGRVENLLRGFRSLYPHLKMWARFIDEELRARRSAGRYERGRYLGGRMRFFYGPSKVESRVAAMRKSREWQKLGGAGATAGDLQEFEVLLAKMLGLPTPQRKVKEKRTVVKLGPVIEKAVPPAARVEAPEVRIPRGGGVDVEELATTLEQMKARWQSVGLAAAGDALELAQGYVPPEDPVAAGEIDPLDAPLLQYEGGATPEEPVLRARELRAVLNARDFRTQAVQAAGAGGKEAEPARWDWRDVRGKNWVTPPKPQGDCGSCVAFAVAGAMEARCRIQADDAAREVDLSEAHLFYCHAAKEKRTCETGWFVTAALRAAESKGVVDEQCFPYKAGDQECRVCAKAEERLMRVKGWEACSTHAEMKRWLRKTGPLVTAMTIYADFQKYASGIYQPVLGSDLGGHAVLCIGYDDKEQCWIAKNSWRGTKWGEGGFFRIAYGACGFDARMWGVKAVEGFLA